MEYTMALWQIVLLASLWPLSFWYLLRFEKEALIDQIDCESSRVTLSIALGTPLVAIVLGMRRWHEWSLD